ncbi:putative protein S-acyltransferase [Microsporum canis]|uniref:C2H2-type domain-containing protein n=1 Tax=Arthroderma otae (strain ATCC MYA-4605 / CBS 113480) TaxID=554155 RepID=C5FMD5_ARTOC|nr:conserved hypothetical protein [Microsporum canis CBS 113480]EEQ31038.1 conserved hypothetical protein [Microsporum canis CBS 113480]
MENQKPAKDPRAFPCPYEGCLQAFPSAGQLINHKKFTADHEYCERCNEDFQFEEDLLLHKMKSSRHIICPVCFDDFRSEGGRDVHIQQFHREEQKIECIGCKAKFLRAAALMVHIEQGRCEKISVDKYRMRRVEKKAVKEAMDDQLLAHHAFLLSSATSSIDGGVGVDGLLGESSHKVAEIEAKKASITEKMSSLGLGAGLAGNSAIPDALAGSKSVRSTKQWPTLPGGDSVSDGSGPLPRYNYQMEDLMAFSDAPDAGRDDDRPTIETIIPGPRAPSASGSGWDTSRIVPARTLTEMEISRKISLSEGELSKFFSEVHGTYICPCDTSFKTKKELEQHISSGVHAGGVARCPVCLRMFKSSAALVAHCESATKRCKISQTKNFGQVIDEISGGIIGAAGRNEDGTVRFEAAPGAKAIEW